MGVCLFTDMEQHTWGVDFVIENPDEDLLMRIEEQISIQVAKTESDEESGEEGDPVMVTCGKLIISSPDKEEADEALDDCGENEENQHFALMSIEKVDEEDFEAVFEVNSDIDEIGLSESDIKALELMESKEFIVLTDNTERTPKDDFSTSVLKFQDAIENYTKSVFSGISDTISGLEKAKNVKNDQEIEAFSEIVSEAQETYAGRTPVVEEPFEEVRISLCGESNDFEESNGDHFFPPLNSESVAENSYSAAGEYVGEEKEIFCKSSLEDKLHYSPITNSDNDDQCFVNEEE